MNSREHPEYDKGVMAARYVIMSNNTGNGVNNPNPYGTPEWEAWQLGFDTTLRSEQP